VARWVFVWPWLIPKEFQAMIIQMPSRTKKAYLRFGPFACFLGRSAGHEAEVRTTCCPLKQPQEARRHFADLAQYNPDLWVDEYYFLNRRDRGYSVGSLYDYQNNLKVLPKCSSGFRTTSRRCSFFGTFTIRRSR